MIVTPSSGIIGHINETVGSLCADHRSMTRFSSSDDYNFQRVVSILRRWTDQIATHKPRKSPGVVPIYFWNDEYQGCLKSLDFALSRVRYKTVDLPYKHTYNWLYDPSTGFHDWLKGLNANTIFWISGKPGSGKSTLMKYAMTQKRTMDYLRHSNDNDWIIAGYFFHDRGTRVQKSIEGFLHEILYQLLARQPELFDTVRSIFDSVLERQRRNDLSKAKKTKFEWTLHELSEALMKIAEESASDLCLCLFVDALDEHAGDHKHLISILHKLAKVSRSNFNLRLCVAGRPENIFKDAFRDFPGFPIHERTQNDIQHYAEDRIKTEHVGHLNVESTEKLGSLIEKVVQMSKGVFLWVRLVINEAVEGLCEGDSIRELQTLLSEVPTELEDLFARAIRRGYNNRRMSARDKLETYTLFQVALLPDYVEMLKTSAVLAVALYAKTKQDPIADLRENSLDQLQRRLNSRSYGLLESVTVAYVPSNVQFIHQTVKDFITSGAGKCLIEDGIDRAQRKSGALAVIEFALGDNSSLLQYLRDVDHKPRRDRDLDRDFDRDFNPYFIFSFWNCAELAETDGTSIRPLLLKALRRPGISDALEDLSTSFGYGDWSMDLESPGGLLKMYLQTRLPLSLQDCLELYRVHDRERAIDDLLAMAIRGMEKNEPTNVSTLCRARLGRWMAWDSFDRLQDQIEQWAAYPHWSIDGREDTLVAEWQGIYEILKSQKVAFESSQYHPRQGRWPRSDLAPQRY